MKSAIKWSVAMRQCAAKRIRLFLMVSEIVTTSKQISASAGCFFQHSLQVCIRRWVYIASRHFSTLHFKVQVLLPYVTIFSTHAVKKDSFVLLEIFGCKISWSFLQASCKLYINDTYIEPKVFVIFNLTELCSLNWCYFMVLCVLV